MAQIKTLNGFRDFAPEDCAVRNYIFATWRNVAKRFGFVEYEVPVVESSELYLKKSGGEIAGQLFRFEDQGGRDISIRPEVTPSLARLVAARQREFQKPMKWFQMGQCFRYERPQKGRLREFYQYNVDLIGEESLEADIELISLSIEVMRELGFVAGDFVVRLSHRGAWQKFCADHALESEEQVTAFMSVIDKWEKLNEEKLNAELSPFGLEYAQVQRFIDEGATSTPEIEHILAGLEQRGLGEFVKVDLAIVRGLAYYTGTVFEVFDLQHNMRAIAGGGRYDELIKTLSDGASDLPVIGFGMGDVVLRNLIEATPQALLKMKSALAQDTVCDVYLVIADEEQRGNAGAVAMQLRHEGIKVDYPLAKAKMGKQFQKAEQLGARYAIVIGSEFPMLQVKNLNERREETCKYSESFALDMKDKLSSFDTGILA